MSSERENPYTRRLFLQQGLTMASMAMTTPLFIERSAMSMMMPLGSMLSSRAGVPEDRVLVVVQLGGGNDGLNTIVPYYADAYYNARPGLAIAAPRPGGNGAIIVDQQAGVGMHPDFSGFKELLDAGAATIVQGVGYPNPNRSHFTSMDIWHTGNTNATGDGWLGRYFDNACHGCPEADAAVAIGNNAPLALTGRVHKPVNFQTADAFRWRGEDIHPTLREAYHELTDPTHRPADDDEIGHMNFLTRTVMDARASSDRIREAVRQSPLVQYPNGNLADQLRIVSAMIRAEMPTRVYYVTLGGFDTHANQGNSHSRLLRQLGDSLNAFYRDMQAQGNSSRVLTMVFSEFGRRVAQNASAGTDHGTAAPMYFVGDMLRPGLLGNHPSLDDLDQGDLRYNVDFRSLYTTVLEDWMRADAQAVLGGRFRKARLFRS
jgi:uncharacterized protein (DUF1501 family)